MIWSVIDEAIRPPVLYGLKTLYELGRVFIYESGLPHDDYRLDENEWYWRETFNPHMDRWVDI